MRTGIVRLFSCTLQPHQFPIRGRLWESVGERSRWCSVLADSFILNICRKQSHSSLPDSVDPYLSSFIITFSTKKKKKKKMEAVVRIWGLLS